MKLSQYLELALNDAYLDKFPILLGELQKLKHDSGRIERRRQERLGKIALM